jgi:ubiquinone/menaquinone biosynthesis C-methylase UbiE
VRVHAVPGPPQPSLIALAYDAIAVDYDQQVAGDAWMRQVLHRQYARVFKPGDRVLDVGCGTGIDAFFLAGRYIHVTAIDISPEMIGRLRGRIATEGLADRIDARVLAVQDVSALEGQRFDGLISAFAGLSTLPDLSGFAHDAARLVRPGGHLVLHLLNRFSLWEWLGYLSRRNWRSARQVGRVRSRQFTIGGQPVQHTLYFADEAYRGYFARDFALREAYALGALRPPHTVQRIPRALVRGLEWLDVRTGTWPLLEHAGRFWVLHLQRLPT